MNRTASTTTVKRWSETWEREHALLQAILGTLFTNNTEAWGVYGLTEQRVQLTPTRYRAPDVCVMPVDSPWEKNLTHPLLIAIRILSSEEIRRVSSVRRRACVGDRSPK